MGEVLGVDVSHYQGDIDWKKVAAADKKFSIIKCMYEKSRRIDEYFKENYRQCGIYGISRGVYIFIASSSIADPVGDAKALLRHLADRPLEYGIWLDFEADVLRKKGKQKIQDFAYTYANMFRSAGYYTGIYCNKDWYDNVITDMLKEDFEFWIARYPKNDTGQYYPKSSLRPNYRTTVAWQYSSKGHVDGIKGLVDLDVDYDGVVSLIAQEPYKKTNLEIAKEVLQGTWGTAKSNPSRKKLLTMAGYDYEKIQEMVNELLKR